MEKIYNNYKKTNIKLEEFKQLLLTESNLNFSKDEMCILSFMRLCKKERITKELLQFAVGIGCELNSILDCDNLPLLDVSDYGHTPMDRLCDNNSITLEILKVAIELGGDLNIINKYDDCTPLGYLCENKSITLEMLQFVVEHGGDFTIKKYYGGGTPLHNLIYNKSITKEILKFIIDFNSNSMIANEIDLLYKLCLNQSITINLLKYAGNYNEKFMIKTPCQDILYNLCRTRSTNVELIRYAVIHGCDFNIAEHCVHIPSHVSTKTSLQILCDNKSTTLELLQFVINHDKNCAIITRVIRFQYDGNGTSLYTLCKYTSITKKQVHECIKKRNMRMLILLQLLRYTLCGPIILEEIMCAI
jgi:hypothetical protein